MKIKIIYENKFQTLEVRDDELSAWLNIDVNMPEEELQKCVQEKIDKLFNRPDYNNWHKFNRHRAYIKKPFRRDDEPEDTNDEMDYVADNSEEENRNRQYDYEAVCQKIRNALKPNYAEVLIAIVLDEKTPEEYAAEIGDTREAVYKRLQRAKKKFEKIFK